MSELLQLLTMTPHPLPMDMVRVHSVITPEDGDGDCHCPRCNLDLPESAFYRNPTTGRRHTVCRECSYKKSARYMQRKAQK